VASSPAGHGQRGSRRWSSRPAAPSCLPPDRPQRGGWPSWWPRRTVVYTCQPQARPRGGARPSLTHATATMLIEDQSLARAAPAGLRGRAGRAGEESGICNMGAGLPESGHPTTPDEVPVPALPACILEPCGTSSPPCSLHTTTPTRWAATAPASPTRPSSASSSRCWSSAVVPAHPGRHLLGHHASAPPPRLEWIATGLAEHLHLPVLDAYDRMLGLQLDDLAVDGPPGGRRAGSTGRPERGGRGCGGGAARRWGMGHHSGTLRRPLGTARQSSTAVRPTGP
jgi:hypothetical protein